MKKVIRSLFSFLLIAVLMVPLMLSNGITVKAAEKKKITGFDQSSYQIEAEKGTLEEIKQQLPESILVYLEDGEDVIDCDWYCTDDYENTDFDVYSFELKLPKGYELADDLSEWDMPYAEVLIKGEKDSDDIQPRTIWKPNNNGTTTLDKYLGVKTSIVDYLNANANKYLGTPYNGDITNTAASGTPGVGMNCTGFVGHVLMACGADLSPIVNTPSTSGYNGPRTWTNMTWWTEFLASHPEIQSYKFGTTAEALASGVLEKGDLVIYEPDQSIWDSGHDAYGNAADCHIGFFWGDSPSDNKFWHSSHPTVGCEGSNRVIYAGTNPGNQISQLAPKCVSYVYVVKTVHNGYITLKKESNNPTMTEGNACYSLADAEYGVYKDAACKNRVATLKTDASGNTNPIKVPIGTYYVKETKASTGYNLDPKTYKISVTSSNTEKNPVKVTSKEDPTNEPAGIELLKIDQETGSKFTQGAASLEGAEFTVTHYGQYYTKEQIESGEAKKDAEANGIAVRSWVIQTKEVTYSDGTKHYAAGLTDKYKVTGDDWFFDIGGVDPVLPRGTLTIEETKAPTGYKLEGSTFTPKGTDNTVEGLFYGQIITNHDGTQLIGGNEFTMSDKVIRGDIEFYKTDDETGHKMANIPFYLESVTTGERHYIKTDENGYFSTASQYEAHSNNTNANDAKKDDVNAFQSCGVWFGLKEDGSQVTVNDEAGALPYDTYKLVELPCEANEGKALFDEKNPIMIVLSKDNYTVDMGTISNHDLSIHTTAKDEKTGTHYSCASDSVTIIDTVSFVGLEKNKNYKLEAHVMAKDGTPILDADGNEIIATKEFKPKTKDGDVEVEINFNGSNLKGKDIVIFEYLYQDDTLITAHTDKDDKDQTIHFPKIGTSAKDGVSDTNVVNAAKDIEIKDTVKYSNLNKGKSYTVTGKLMDKETGKEVKDDNGDVITSKTTFTAEDTSGEVVVTFKFSGVKLAGKTLVAFESVEYGDQVLAVHEDIEDEEQTVYLPKLGTKATDQDTESKNSYADDKITIIDEASYENLVPGETYKVVGTIMNQKDGSIVKAKKWEEKEIPKDAEEFECKAGTVYFYIGEKISGTMTTKELPKGLYQYTVNASGEDIIENVKTSDTFTKDDLEQFDDIVSGKAEEVSWYKLIESDGKIYVADDVVYYNSDSADYALTEKAEEIKAEVTFTAKEANGTVEIPFTFDGTGLEGTTFVVFEELYLVKDDNEHVVAEHKDINDTDQTVYVPSIRTTALDADTQTHVVKTGDKVTVTDTVHYENLLPGTEYLLQGILMDKETGKELVVSKDDANTENGTGVSNEITFTPTKATGDVDITFTFNASALEGKSAVVFETLKIKKEDVPNDKDTTVAVHKDLNDDSQTVNFSKEGEKSGKSTVQTGDNSALILIVAMILLLGASVVQLKKKH